MKTLTIIMAGLLSASMSHSSGIHNYAEIGAGFSQLFSFNSDANDSLKDYDAAPSFKVLVGSRLNKARTLWFELNYSNNGEMTYEDETFASQSAGAGLKFTTDPRNGNAFFVRLGAGKTWNEVSNSEADSQKSQGTHYYAGLGMSFYLDAKRAIVFDVQHIDDKETDVAINGAFVSFRQFL